MEINVKIKQNLVWLVEFMLKVEIIGWRGVCQCVQQPEEARCDVRPRVSLVAADPSCHLNYKGSRVHHRCYHGIDKFLQLITHKPVSRTSKLNLHSAPNWSEAPTPAGFQKSAPHTKAPSRWSWWRQQTERSAKIPYKPAKLATYKLSQWTGNELKVKWVQVWIISVRSHKFM